MMQHSPEGLSRVREGAAAGVLCKVATAGYIVDGTVRECAVRGLAILFASPGHPRDSAAVASELIPSLVRAIRQPTSFSVAALADAIALLRRLAAPGPGRRLLVIQAWGDSALLSVLNSAATPPELIADAAAALVSLADAENHPRARFAEALCAVLRLPAAEASHAPALSALFASARSSPEFERELLQPGALRGVAECITKTSAAAAAATQQHARRARCAFCLFAARSLEHAEAVFQQGGLPLLVEAMVSGPAEARQAATDALRLVATKGGPPARIAILEARQRLDAQLGSARYVRAVALGQLYLENSEAD